MFEEILATLQEEFKTALPLTEHSIQRNYSFPGVLVDWKTYLRDYAFSDSV